MGGGVQRWRRWFILLVPTTGCLVANPAWVGGDGGSEDGTVGIASMSRGDGDEDDDEDDDAEGTRGDTTVGVSGTVGVTEDGGEATLGPPPGSTALPPPADWWDTAWKYRRLVELELPIALEAPLAVAIRVEGSDDRLRFAELGHDIRFVTSSGDQVAHEIDVWQPLDGSPALVWLRLSPGHDVEPLYMYYGNPSASPRTSSTDVWAQEYDGVWHLGDGLDASGQSSVLDPLDQIEPGVLGDSAAFDFLGGEAAFASLGDVVPQSVTITAWILPMGTGEEGEGRIVDLVVPATQLDVTLHVVSTQGPPSLATSVTVDDVTATSFLPDFPLVLGEWQFVALTLSDGGELALYVDGDGGGSADLEAEMGVPPMLMDATITIGGSVDGEPTRFDGNIDEVRIRPEFLAAEEVYAEYIAQVGQAALLGIEEQL